MQIQDAEALAALEAIKQLKARYFRCLDLKDWVSYGETFASDATLSVESLRRGVDGGPMLSRTETGRAAIITWVSGILDGAVTIHHGHMPEISLKSWDAASGIWVMEDRVIWRDRWLHGWGHYHETYRRIDGEWHIQTSCLTRLHVERSGASISGSSQSVMLDESLTSEAMP